MPLYFFSFEKIEKNLKMMKNKKGVAGLNIFLSVIAMIFVIGILVMAFTLSGATMQDAVRTSYGAASEPILLISNTTAALAGTTTWFPIFITIAAIVVLILLIVLIVVALRGAGLMGGEYSN